MIISAHAIRATMDDPYRRKVLQNHPGIREGIAGDIREVLLAMQDGDVIVFANGVIVERIGNEWEVDCPDQ